MPSEKKFGACEKNSIQELIERLGYKIAAGCLFYDMTPGGRHDMYETFVKMIGLIILCNEKKYYAERDKALVNLFDSLDV